MSKKQKNMTGLTDIEKTKGANINVALISENDELNNLETSKCVLRFSGNSINYVIVSTLRRVIMSLIPCYAFNVNNIKITSNTSVFVNDMLKLRFSNFPIYLRKELNQKYKNLKKLEHVQVINPHNTIEQFQKLEYKANLGSAEIDRSSESLEKENIKDNLIIAINVKNVESTIMDVMTNTPGVKYYYKSEQISHIYSTPLLLVQLQPGQELSCSMTADLNIAMSNAIYRPCSLCHAVELDKNTFDFTLMSKRQVSERDMFMRACEIIKVKAIHARQIFHENISKYTNNEENTHTDDVTSHFRIGKIMIEGEQHTMGNLLARYIQDHPDIINGGYKVGHPNVNNCEIGYESKKNILDIIDDVTNQIVAIYDNIHDQIEKLPNFAYQYN
jgi:DNA-directed RNA polymerase subunit L